MKQTRDASEAVCFATHQPKLLEDAFRQYGPSSNVDFLLEHGATFDTIPCGLPKLLEDTFRQYGRGPYVAFLLEHGATFDTIPCGLPKLLEDTFRQYGRGPYVAFLLEHGATFDTIPCGLPKLLEDTFRQYGRGPYVAFLLEQQLASLEHSQKYRQAWQLVQRSLDMKLIKSQGTFVGMLGIYVNNLLNKPDPKDASFLKLIDRQEKLTLLQQPDLPTLMRYAIESTLLADSLPTLTLRKSGENLTVQVDVAVFWSDYFRAACSGGFAHVSNFDLEQDDLITLKSLRRLQKFMYTGICPWADEAATESDLRVSEYFCIGFLQDVLEERLLFMQS